MGLSDQSVRYQIAIGIGRCRQNAAINAVLIQCNLGIRGNRSAVGLRKDRFNTGFEFFCCGCGRLRRGIEQRIDIPDQSVAFKKRIPDPFGIGDFLTCRSFITGSYGVISNGIGIQGQSFLHRLAMNDRIFLRKQSFEDRCVKVECPVSGDDEISCTFECHINDDFGTGRIIGRTVNDFPQMYRITRFELTNVPFCVFDEKSTLFKRFYVPDHSCHMDSYDFCWILMVLL